MKKLFNKGLAALVISILLVLISFGVLLFSDYIIEIEHYLGFLLITVSTILYFINKKIFVYVFVSTLVLGIVNVIDIIFINFSFGISMIRINPLFLILLIMFIGLNKAMLNKMFPDTKSVN